MLQDGEFQSQAAAHNYERASLLLHKRNGVQEMLNSPEILFGIVAAVFLLFGAAVRITRSSFAGSIQSFHTYIDSEHQIDHSVLYNWAIGKDGFLSSFKIFWGRMPRRIWNFYIEAFLIPAYRKEWGIYGNWSFRSRDRPKKPPYLRRLLRERKLLREKASSTVETHTHQIPHNHSGCKRVRINISGMLYETQLRTLERFPDTLLGNPAKRIQYFDPFKQEYYFDRNRLAFDAILYYYQSGGRFRRPDNIQADVLLEDALFFQLSPMLLDLFRIEEGLAPASSKYEVVPISFLRRKIWLLFDFPESSVQAAFVAVLSISALFVSISVFCIETVEDMQLKPVYGLLDEETGEFGITHTHDLEIADPFFLTEAACNIWFILEFGMRFLSCPFYGKFLRSPLNLIDLVALMPFLISVLSPSVSTLFTDHDHDEHGHGKHTESKPSTATDSLYLLRIVRVVRVFRIFKLSRHSRGLKILGKTLKASLNELILLMFFIVLGVVLFSSAMYFAELDHPETPFTSIPDGFWFSLITITTVGFGDVVPQTVLGKVVGSLCAVAGVLTIALPVPVIVSNFNFFYHQAIDEGDLKWISLNHVSHCPYRPAGYSIDVLPQKTKKGRKSRVKPPSPKYSSDEEFGELKKMDQE